jgi:hypothetical protein
MRKASHKLLKVVKLLMKTHIEENLENLSYTRVQDYL